MVCGRNCCGGIAPCGGLEALGEIAPVFWMTGFRRMVVVAATAFSGMPCADAGVMVIGLIAGAAGAAAAGESGVLVTVVPFKGVPRALAGGCIGLIVIGLMPMGRCVLGVLLSSAILFSDLRRLRGALGLN